MLSTLLPWSLRPYSNLRANGHRDGSTLKVKLHPSARSVFGGWNPPVGCETRTWVLNQVEVDGRSWGCPWGLTGAAAGGLAATGGGAVAGGGSVTGGGA
jgi:hypothetical protein